MPSILIQGGRVIDPASGTDRTADVAIEDGLIRAIGTNLPATGLAGGAGRVIDASGRIVAPGLIDPHVHLREPGHEHKETILGGSLAAAAGGFTTVCCMPNTVPALDSPVVVEFVKARAAAALARGGARVFPVAATTAGRKGERLAEISLLASAGAVGFSDDGDCIASAGVMARALRAIAPTGLAFMQHCQEPTLTQGASMNAGDVAVRQGLIGWPAVAEEIIIERDVRLNRAIGCRYHVQHISSGGSVEIIRRARAEGAKGPHGEPLVTAEASPHHLLLTDEACDGFNTAAKMNPPLRTARDVQALREGVADGTITVLATDHAPHTLEEKSLPFESAPFGIIGLETALALYAEALVSTGLIDWPRLIALITINAARLCNLDERGLGMLAEGGPADVTIIDPDLAWTIGESALAGAGRNTPFLGREARGRAVTTIIGGRVVWEAAGAERTPA